MKRYPALIILMLSLWCSTGRSHEAPLPFDAFLDSETAVQEMRLSPDGDKVAYIAGNSQYDTSLIYVLDLKTGKASGVEAPNRWSFDDVSWMSSDRLLGSYFGGYVAVNADGKNYTSVNSSNGRIGSLMYVFPRRDKKHQEVLFQNNYFPSDKMDIDHRGDSHGYSRPDVLTINVQTGRYATLCKNPGDIVEWFADRNGEVCLALELRDEKLSLVHRSSAEAPWVPVPGLRFSVHEKTVLGLSNDGDRVFIGEDKSIDESTLHLYNLKTGAMEGEVLTIKHGHFYRLIKAPDNRVIGVRFMDSQPRIFWFDESYGRVQKAMEARLPGQFVSFINSSADESKLLFFATSPQNPGTYYLLDIKQGSLAKLVDVDPKAPFDHLSNEIAINLKARDGLTLPGFLMLPVGQPARNLPLIVWAHSGPWSRNALGYHNVLQFLANRGYAILIVDYRGSYGYTYAYYRAGFRQLGTGMLTDLEDATTAALKSGMFDPKRVAVMGWGFGGYCAYMCAIRSPGLFACGVTVDAIVDWTDRGIKSNASNPDYYGFDEEHLGDPKADPAAFAQMTPLGLVEQIKVPFLVAYDDMGNPDRSEDKKMVKAMKKAGCNIQTVDGYSNGSFYTRKGSLDLYPKVAAFLDAHMK